MSVQPRVSLGPHSPFLISHIKSLSLTAMAPPSPLQRRDCRYFLYMQREQVLGDPPRGGMAVKDLDLQVGFPGHGSA